MHWKVPYTLQNALRQRAILLILIGICGDQAYSREEPSLTFPYRWSVKNPHAACFGRFKFSKTRLFCMSGHSDAVQDCKRTCANNPVCTYIEYFRDSRYCAGFRASCRKPTLTKHGAQSYVFTRWRTRSTGYACGGESNAVFSSINTTLYDCKTQCELHLACVHIDFYLESKQRGYCFGFSATCTNPRIKTGYNGAWASSYVLPKAKQNELVMDTCPLRKDAIQLKGSGLATVAAIRLCKQPLHKWISNKSMGVELDSSMRVNCPCPTCILTPAAAPATYCMFDQEHTPGHKLLEHLLLRRWMQTTWKYSVPIVVVATPWAQCPKEDLYMLSIFWVSLPVHLPLAWALH